MIARGEAPQKHEKYYLNKLRQDFEKNGVGIAYEKLRDDFKRTQERIEYLTREALKNLNGNSSGIWFTKDELQGLPEDLMARCLVHARGSTESVGESEFWIRIKEPDIFPV